MTRKKNIIMIAMCVAVLIMVVGYAAFATRLTINGTGNITSLWQIEITSITSSATGEAYDIDSPSYNGTTATFNAGFNKPGDKMTYTVKVENTGNIGAIISDATVDATGTPAIIYSIQDLQYGIRLGAGESTTFKVISEFDINATEIPSDTTKTITINIVAIQDQNQTLTPTTPTIDQEKMLVTTILNDNNEQADTNIDFGAISSSTNGKGLYYTSTNTQGNKKTYYFRGAVENNYIEFAGITWRIVRINEDGSVRLITEDSIGESKYSSLIYDNAYVGYMYGEINSTTYEKTHANKNNSTIKTYLDTWFKNSTLLNHSDYLVDSGFCNDRTLKDTTGINNAMGFYGMFNRLINPSTWSIADASPQFACIQRNDLFTVNNGIGNKALDYPVGLLTVDEAWYAGVVYGTDNSSAYLNNGDSWWTMTPWSFDGLNALIGIVKASGQIGPVWENSLYKVRPVINIKGDLEVTSGNGTSGNPYKVSTTAKNTLVSKIFSSTPAYADNTSSSYVSSSTGINFGSVSSSTNGQGLYYTSTNTEGNGTTYYFRGNVTNNYVKFAKNSSGQDLYWRIVRINEDGSIRLIYQGTSATATGSDAAVGTSAFNSTANDNAYVGYMYGEPGASTYLKMHANTNDSTIKSYLDTWYANNLKANYSKYLVDSGFCNDRSLFAGGFGYDYTYLGVHGRIISATGALTQQYACPNASNDLFTTGESGKGNRALKYPIGLITADEVVYAGGLNSMNASNQNITTNNNYYLYTGSFYWTMSGGYSHNAIGTHSVPVFDSGLIAYKLSNEASGVRPVINLKQDIEITTGTGTSGSPYVIKTS